MAHMAGGGPAGDDPDRVWGSLSRDPRRPEQAAMRASDADRDVVLVVLAEAYAEGRITHEEHDARTTRTQAARTVGELVEPLEGLVSPRTTPGLPAHVRDDVARRAEAGWRKDRREAAWGLVSVAAITWTIWLATAWDDGELELVFPWPAFVTVIALLNLVRIQVQREELVERTRRRLERHEDGGEQA